MNQKKAKRLRRIAHSLTKGQPEVVVQTRDGRHQKFNAHNVCQELKRTFLKGAIE